MHLTRIRTIFISLVAVAAFAGPLVGAAHAAAPTSTGAPQLAQSGTQPQGTVLTVQSQAMWDASATSITDTWEQCDSTGNNCAPVTPAVTGSTYTIPVDSTNLGTEIMVSETATNSTDVPPSTSTSVLSNAITVLPAPVSTSAPVITGNALEGRSLTATQGSWNNSPTTFAYEWDDCTGSTCTASPTSTNSSSYTVTAGDADAQIEVQVTATNADGSTTATSLPTSAATGLPVGSGQPTITGTTWQGQTLTDSTHGTWTNFPTSYTYQWLRCNPACTTKIPGATRQSYVLTSADVGSTIAVSETAANGAGPSTTTPLMSAATPVITLPPPGANAPPSISGTAQQGMTLTEGAAHWTNSPTSITVTWYRCDSNGSSCVATGTGPTYLLTADDLGALIQVSETASNASNVPVISVSPYAGPVATPAGHFDPPSVKPGSEPAISGVAQLGRTLTASRAQFNGNPGNFSDQWLRCNALACSSIPGETDLTYTPTSADVGDSVAFTETATNSGGTSSVVTSGRTSTITAPSTTSLQTSSSAPAAGQAVTLVATVTSAAGAVKPVGTVEFSANGAAIPGCVGLTLGNAAPTAVCQTSFPASTANVTAVYSAAAGTFITGSTSSPAALAVGRAATSVTVTTGGHVSLGSKTTYTATVLAPAGSSLTPTGRIAFRDAGKTIKGCGKKVLAAHKTTCSVKYLGLTTHRISARYTGDTNFVPSGSVTSHVRVQPQSPRGFVAVYLNWTFGFTRSSTRIRFLSASGLSAGIGIAVTCQGSGCPFAHRAMTVTASRKCGKQAKPGCIAGQSFNLTPIFHGAHLSVGTHLIIAVTHHGWVGKYYLFTMRSSRKPAIAESCLAVDGTRPGVGCSAG